MKKASRDAAGTERLIERQGGRNGEQSNESSLFVGNESSNSSDFRSSRLEGDIGRPSAPDVTDPDAGFTRAVLRASPLARDRIQDQLAPLGGRAMVSLPTSRAGSDENSELQWLSDIIGKARVRSRAKRHSQRIQEQARLKAKKLDAMAVLAVYARRNIVHLDATAARLGPREKRRHSS